VTAARVARPRGAAGATGGLLLLAALLGPGCGPSSPGSAPPSERAGSEAWFADVTAECGLDFVHDAGPTGGYFMPGIIGSGAALFDFDNDGRLDIYLIQNGGPSSTSRNRLFRQLPGGRFADASAGSGLDVAGHGMGAAAGDLDNDGWCDLLLTEYGRSRLFLNEGGVSFADVSSEAGLDNPAWGTSAAFFDFDLDGRLDIVIANYVLYSATRPCTDQAGRRDYCGPAPFPGTVARLFHNLGRGTQGAAGGLARLRLEDVTVRSGLARLPGPGLGVFCADFDGDGWPDIFVANDGRPNHLWMNQQDGTFQEEAVLRGLAYNGDGKAQADMGIACADVDGNGLFDLYVTHLTDEHHALWKQEPRGLFLDRTAEAGLTRSLWRGTGFGAVMADFDHDGAPDLAQVNGRVKFVAGPSPAGRPFWEAYEERNQLFRNLGGGVFRDISPGSPAFCGEAAVARGLAAGDLDGDGAIDLLVTAVGGPARILRNVAPRKGRSLMVRAVDPALGGRDAYGAEVTVRAGGRSWTALINPAYSYLSSNDPRAHFGLGAAESVEAIEVLWPGGGREVFSGTPGALVVVRRGEGRPAEVAR
jgi:hypothetical protein